jgi:hypothetical protein
MVSNLMVVCGDRDVSPVVNTDLASLRPGRRAERLWTPRGWMMARKSILLRLRPEASKRCSAGAG